MLIDIIEECFRENGLEVKKNPSFLGKELKNHDKDDTVQNFLSTLSGQDLETMAKGIDALRVWTEQWCATVVYDSNTDPFTEDGLFTKIKNKPNIALIATTTDGDVFGCFYTVAVKEQNSLTQDLNMFAFSFESHGRCETPQRFAAKPSNPVDAVIVFWSNTTNNAFVGFGGERGSFGLGNVESDTWCLSLSELFEGIEDETLTGKDGMDAFHHCSRLVAVHFE